MDSLGRLFGARTAEVVPDAITAALAGELRARTRYTRYSLLDRGSYDVAPFSDAPLFAKLAALVEKRLQQQFAVTEARIVRLGPGDYLLAHHDVVYEGNPLELVLDISDAPTPGAELHYRRRGQVYFRVPSQPRAMALIERGPTVTCNHTYVSKLHTGASVVRLFALLR